MYISPQLAIDNGWIKFPDGMTAEQQAQAIQPNAIDFTLDMLFSIDDDATFWVSEDSKTMRGGAKQSANEETGYWHLDAKKCYDGLSNIYVNLPEGVACELIIRSTLNRNGIFLTSGLYDSGYKGNIGFAVHNNSGPAGIKPGTRIGQIKFVKAEKAGTYAGGWNHEEGEHWSDSKNGEQK